MTLHRDAPCAGTYSILLDPTGQLIKSWQSPIQSISPHLVHLLSTKRALGLSSG